METQDQNKLYLVQMYNKYGRFYEELKVLNKKEVTWYLLEGYVVEEVNHFYEID